MACKVCGGAPKANEQKLKVVFGTTVAIAIAALLAGTPMGWLALFAAGGPQAAKMFHLKMLAAKESEQAGGYFECRDCGRDMSIGEALGL